jgi:phage/plasmid-like protein (TIGR03299 family)
MAHEIKRMAYTGPTPWHGLGKVLSDPSDLDRCRVEAGLDWDVKLAPVFLADGSAVECGNAVVRCDTGEAISLVGPGFVPLSNADAFEWFRPWLTSGEATIETAGELHGGNRVWILAKVAGTEFDVGHDDVVQPYILLAHGHGGPKTLAIRAGLTAVRVVCHNTLSMAIGDGDGMKGSSLVKIPHTAGARTSLDNVRQAIDAVRAHCAAVAELFRALTRIPVTSDATVRAFVDAVYGAPVEREDGRPNREPRKEEIVRLFHEGVGSDLVSARGTMWGLWQALTEYETHAATSEKAAANIAARVNGLAFGKNGQKIAAALRVLRATVESRPMNDADVLVEVERVLRAEVA